jgi:hypothetical protein
MVSRFAAAVCLVLVIGLGSGQEKKAPALPGGKSKLPPEPGYERRVIEGWQTLINKKVFDQPLDSYENPPFAVLEDELKSINRLIAPKILKELQVVPIWVEWDEGEKKENGSRTVAVYYGGSVFAYLRGDAKVNPKKANQIELMTLKFLTELKQPPRPKQQVVLLHELIHAVHDKILGRENPEILAAYQQAKERRLYANVEHRTGPRREAYANTNHAEYFAEISCMFLDVVDYFPYDREGLKVHDPEGYKVAEKVWGKVVAKPKAEVAKAAPKPAPKPDAPRAEAPRTEADPEKAAAGKLDLIRELIKDGKKERARERLAELIKAYPATKAADDARRLLEELR